MPRTARRGALRPLRAWNVYAWLTSSLNVDEGGVRLALLASMGTMLFVARGHPLSR